MMKAGEGSVGWEEYPTEIPSTESIDQTPLFYMWSGVVLQKNTLVLTKKAPLPATTVYLYFYFWNPMPNSATIQLQFSSTTTPVSSTHLPEGTVPISRIPTPTYIHKCQLQTAYKERYKILPLKPATKTTRTIDTTNNLDINSNCNPTTTSKNNTKIRLAKKLGKSRKFAQRSFDTMEET